MKLILKHFKTSPVPPTGHTSFHEFFFYVLLGRKKVYERRMVHANCYNGRDYETPKIVESCACDKSDYQCDFGFKQDDSWSTGCIKDPKFHHDPYDPPHNCPSGTFYNLTRGYVKIRGDTCIGGNAKVYEPQRVRFLATSI